MSVKIFQSSFLPSVPDGVMLSPRPGSAMTQRLDVLVKTNTLNYCDMLTACKIKSALSGFQAVLTHVCEER